MPAANPRNSSDDRGFRSVATTRKTGTPATLNEKDRSVECVVMTEAAVRTYLPAVGDVVPEVVLLDGMRFPASNQVVLLDSHSRYGTGSVLGSIRDLRREGSELVGRAVFSTAAEAEGPWTKVREGHLTDLSGGYRRIKTVWVDEGKSAVINGRTFAGPVSVCIESELVEGSITPIGADRDTRIRTAEPITHPGDTAGIKTEESPMLNEATRKMLVAAGMKPEATEEEAERFLAEQLAKSKTPPPAPAAPTPPSATPPEPIKFGEAERQAAIAEGARIEAERQTGIRQLAELVNLDGEFVKRMIDGKITVDDARRQALDELAKRRAPTVTPPTITVTRDATDAYRAAAIDGLAIRGGMKIEKPAPGYDELAGLTLREMARDCLRRAGLRVHGDIRDVVGRALTTSDFPYILAAVSNKSLMAGWDDEPQSYVEWVDDSGSVPDFKTATLARAGEFDDLEQVKEGGEYKHATQSETREQFAIATYGKLFVITREAIINDDIGALTDTPAKMGAAARRKVGDLPYAVLSANANMGDGVALFEESTYHKNYVSSGGVVSATTYDVGRQKMAAQKDLNGKQTLNIVPAFYIGGQARMATAETFFQSIYKDASNMQANIFAQAVKRVYESRITGNEWYLAARKGKTIRLFFLNGVKTPYTEQRTGWTTDGTEMKVRIDAVAKAVDYRGLFKNAGA